MDPLVYYEKESSKKYDPNLAMVSNMVYGGCELSELSLISVLNSTPKNILALMFKNILILWFEISAQNLAFKTSLGNHSFHFLLLKLAKGLLKSSFPPSQKF